jgi:hypothetical protein
MREERKEGRKKEGEEGRKKVGEEGGKGGRASDIKKEVTVRQQRKVENSLHLQPWLPGREGKPMKHNKQDNPGNRLAILTTR